MAEEHREQGGRAYDGEGAGEVKDRGLFDFLGKKDAEEKKPDEGDYLAAGVQNIHIEEGYKAQEGKKKEEEEQHEKEEKEGEKHHGLLDKLHRSHSSSSSSSSSDEEVEIEGEGGIKEKIKKKTLKEKIIGKPHGEGVHHEEEKERHEEEKEHREEEKKHHEEEKKHHEEERKHHEELKNPVFLPAPPVEVPKVRVEEVELHEPAASEEEKKGFLDKIKEKLPGHTKKPAEEGAHVPPPEAVEATGEHVKVVHEGAEGPEGKEKKGFLGKIVDKLSGHHKSAGEEGDKSPASH